MSRTSKISNSKDILNNIYLRGRIAIKFKDLVQPRCSKVESDSEFLFSFYNLYIALNVKLYIDILDVSVKHGQVLVQEMLTIATVSMKNIDMELG